MSDLRQGQEDHGKAHAGAGIVPTREAIDRLLAEFGRLVGIDGFALDADGEGELRLDGDLELSLKHYAHLPGLVAAAPIRNLPLDDANFLKTMMQANMAWRLTRGGIFARLPGGRRVMLCVLVPTGHGKVVRFEQDLGAVADLVRFWEAEVERIKRMQRDALEAEEALPDAALRI